MFTGIHGITWDDVAKESAFRTVWRALSPMLDGADFLAAHNAGFDRSVLRACCLRARLRVPQINFVCTMKLARDTWGIRPTRLPNVCDYLGLALKHHDPASDAEACAKIVLHAHRSGVEVCGAMR